MTSLNPSRERAGWKLVPVEPTAEMISAAMPAPTEWIGHQDASQETIARWREGHGQAATRHYAAMLAAAPSPDRPTNGGRPHYVPQDRLERIVRESADEIAGGQPVEDVLRGAIVLALSAPSPAALPSPTSGEEGGGEIERLRADIARLTAERDQARADYEQEADWSKTVDSYGLDGFDDLAARWLKVDAIQRMHNAAASVFAKWSNDELMDRFKTHMTRIMHTAFVEGAIAGVRTALAKPASEPAGGGAPIILRLFGRGHPPVMMRTGDAPDGEGIRTPARMTLPGARFRLDDRVRKLRGSSWQGLVVGFYSTRLTPIGYAVESEREPGSVQIYPESALERVPEQAP